MDATLPKRWKLWLPISLSLVAAPLSALAAWTCFGHGLPSGHAISNVLFPYLQLVLLAITNDDLASLAVLIIPAIQTVAYGILIGRAWQERMLPSVLLFLAGAHVIALVAAWIAVR